ncbi:putative serine-type carboxypeptidase protein [Rosellinia necatrix]|uniref:Carboxypeptidase n=1 Tax=Rosellinia necatrix TaxID=77044 RepID=A0A1S7UMN2_ROSNE|nr:putative serine-type carboxypeptidase protein [Rosellinia necatrix]
MRGFAIATGILSVLHVAEARSWQHVGKKQRDRPTRSEVNTLDYYLATRQVPSPRFANDNTTKFAVNGTGIPDVDFDVGESYAGYLPISDDPDDKNELFFWFFANSEGSDSKEVLLWLNGGPGCSSFEGLIQENGPFQWQYGTVKPVPNPWAWNRLINTVWVEQPIGTGFSRGEVTATSEEDVAKQMLGFWKNFVETFSLQGYKVYIAGESYAGLYCPYIASAMLDANDTTYYDLSGMLIYDPVLGNDIVQEAVTTVPFVDYHHNLMTFNDTFNQHIHELHDSCGFAAYQDKYLTYPPAGPQPSNFTDTVSEECAGLWELVLDNALSVNPCFDVYQVATTCPLLWDVLGFPGSFGYSPAGSGPVYFDREDVKRAIHADTNHTWEECSSIDVFVNNTDTSDPSSWRVLPHVIDATKNVIIGHGTLDMILLPNGTLLTIQNMTWGGQLGFQSPPIEPFFVPFHKDSTPGDIYAETDALALGSIAAAGVMGAAHTERGLTYVGINLSGHMVPQYTPSAAFRHLEFLLGRIDSLSSTKAFTFESNVTQPAADTLGNGTGPSTFSSESSSNTSGSGADTTPGSAASSLGVVSPLVACIVTIAAILNM